MWTSRRLLLVAIWCCWWCISSDAFVGRVQPGATVTAPHTSGKSKTMRHAAAVQAQEEAEEDIFAEGDKVVLSAPSAMKGKKATVVKRVEGDAFAVELESGSVFHIPEENMQMAGGGIGGGIGGIFGGGGSGGGGKGKSPGGSGGAAGEPSSNFDNFTWILSILGGSLFAVWGGILFKNGKLKLPRMKKLKLPQWRVDRKPLSWTSSPGSSPLGALLILAAVGLYIAVTKYLPGFMDWLQDYFSSTTEVIEELIPFRAIVDVKPEEKFSRLDAMLLAAVTVFATIWLVARSKKKKGSGGKALSFGNPCSRRSFGNPNEGFFRTNSPFVRDSKSLMQSRSSYSALPPVGGSKEAHTSLLDGLWPMASTTDPTVEVTFEVEMESVPGDRLLVVGGHENLGEWVAERSLVELSTSNDRYPIWSGKWFPRATPAEYEFKLVLQNKRGQYYWETEEVLNRTLTVSSMRGSQTLKMKFNTPGLGQHQQSKALGCFTPVFSPLAGS